jgi:hypothetical protein
MPADMNQWHVRVDNKGNVDQGDIQRQLQQKANQKVSQFKTGCIISIVMAVLVVGIIAALGIYFAYAWKKSGGLDGSPAAAGAAAAKWDGTSTFSCGGTDAVAITGVTANLKSGDAIDAAGNCKLTLSGVNLTAPTVISASGNAQVTITGGSINGSTAAVDASGNAHVTLVGTKVTGKVSKAGLAKVDGAP